MASLLCATNRGTFPMFELLSCKRRQPDNHWFVFSYSKFLKPVLCISSRPISLDLKYGWIIGGLGFAPQAKCYVILAVRNVTVACVLAPVGVWVDDHKFMSIWRWALAMPNLPAHSGLPVQNLVVLSIQTVWVRSARRETLHHTSPLPWMGKRSTPEIFSFAQGKGACVMQIVNSEGIIVSIFVVWHQCNEIRGNADGYSDILRNKFDNLL